MYVSLTVSTNNWTTFKYYWLLVSKQMIICTLELEYPFFQNMKFKFFSFKIKLQGNKSPLCSQKSNISTMNKNRV